MAKIHLIGNSHLDPVWLWRWTDGYSEILATFRSALDRMEEFPDFKFTCACAAYYQWVEKIDSDMFAQIQQRVAQGRWNITGGWFLQPDCNIPCGESFARHSLIGQRYFQEKFGITAKTGYNVDSFGHNAGLPKILKASGMDHYVFMRPFPEEQGREERLFLWQADDGSEVCTYRIPWYYNYHMQRLELFGKLKAYAQKHEQDQMAFYGVGNHGGGPTIELIEAIKALGIPDMEFSTVDGYFAQTDRSGLPILTGDLQHHARGCYSAGTKVKKANRMCEHNLLAAEILCTMAKKLTGAPYPVKRLNKAWKNLLFNQFHDILAGCTIKKGVEDAQYLFGETMSITEQAIFGSMQKIAWNIDTLQGQTLPAHKEPDKRKVWEHEVLGTPVVVFNPHPWAVTMPVQLDADATRMEDPEGKQIPFQWVRADYTNEADKHHTSFVAQVPAMGYRTYRLFVRREGEHFASGLKVTESVLENEKLWVELDSETGDVSKIFDKTSQSYILDKPCRAVLLDETDCDTWAHGKDDLGPTVGQFGEPEFKVIEDGCVRATVRVTTRYKDSLLQRDFTLFAGGDCLEVKVKVDFHEKHRTLKFTFPMADTKVISQVAYGSITRQGYTGEEPCGAWIASGKLAIANDCKHGYDTQDGEVRMTVLRSAIYADHFGHRDEFCEFMEMGVHEFGYSLFAFQDPADAERRAMTFQYGLRAVKETFHKGSLPESMSCICCDNPNVLISAVKQAEDSDKTVLRIYEMNGTDAPVNISFFDKQIKTALGHNGIKTLQDDGQELNLLEWQMEKKED